MRITLGVILLLTSIAVPCFASRTVKDELGRSVELPDHPHRVVCLVPSVVDIVYALGAGEDAPPFAKFLAGSSLFLWFSVLILGRYIQFLQGTISP